MTERTLDRIVASQEEWARQNRIERDGAYTRTVADNLFGSEMHPATRQEYERGKGRELEGHMKALYSSSALVVNVFDYWRRTDRIGDIARCCGAEGSVTGMEFEKTHPIKGLEQRTPPHLDVEFGGTIPLAIESKFTETYHRKTRRNDADTHLNEYLKHPGIWNGMPGLKAIAEGIVRQSGGRTNFEYLDVPQLIKHILGLHCAYGGKFSFLYLWYRVDSDEAKQHEQELAGFCAGIGNDVTFRTMTYRELFDKIRQVPDADPAYLHYLKERYFTLQA